MNICPVCKNYFTSSICPSCEENAVKSSQIQNPDQRMTESANKSKSQSIQPEQQNRSDLNNNNSKIASESSQNYQFTEEFDQNNLKKNFDNLGELDQNLDNLELVAKNDNLNELDTQNSKTQEDHSPNQNEIIYLRQEINLLATLIKNATENIETMKKYLGNLEEEIHDQFDELTDNLLKNKEKISNLQIQFRNFQSETKNKKGQFNDENQISIKELIPLIDALDRGTFYFKKDISHHFSSLLSQLCDILNVQLINPNPGEKINYKVHYPIKKEMSKYNENEVVKTIRIGIKSENSLIRQAEVIISDKKQKKKRKFLLF